MLQITISKRAAFMVLMAVLLVIPVVALAGAVFDDVSDGSTHIDGITFMKTSGVSVGCDALNNYCPKDNVTREQMGTFMYRLSGNDPATPPSVNADTVDGYEAADLMPGFLLVDEGLLGVIDNVASGTEVCITADYTPAGDEFAVLDGRVSARHDTSSGDLWLRTAISTDSGATWTDTSSRVSPEEVVTTTEDHAMSYVDVVELTSGTTYTFAIEVNGSTFDDMRCQFLVTLMPRSA